VRRCRVVCAGRHSRCADHTSGFDKLSFDKLSFDKLSFDKLSFDKLSHQYAHRGGHCGAAQRSTGHAGPACGHTHRNRNGCADASDYVRDFRRDPG